MDLKTVFPKASQSFLAVNPSTNSDKTISSPIQGAAIGKRRGLMNRTETEFSLMLAAWKVTGEILNYRFEAVKIRVGQGCFFVPDFFIEREGKKPLFIEIKGFLRDDARVKFLAAKEQHDWADFEMWRKIKGSWIQIL